MTESEAAAIPIETHPDPVLAYAVADEEIPITESNGSFDATFGAPAAGTTVPGFFEEFDGVTATGSEAPETHLRRGDAVGIYLEASGEGGPYFARVIAAGEEGGYLVFTDVEDCLDIAETAGVGQVASVISHDLRNPLDVAAAHLQAARETGDAEHFDAVARSHDRMEQIIRDVLTLARGREALNLDEDTFIETAAREAWQSVDTDRATLAVADELPAATADPDRVRRLFENLFRNAVEHGATGSRRGDDAAPAVSVTVGALDAGFYVADDGPGIPSAERTAVLEPGYSSADGGTGLGLAIVDEIVSAHGWELTLTAAQEGGARFEVRF
jgi:signal transduction histidine kinase